MGKQLISVLVLQADPVQNHGDSAHCRAWHLEAVPALLSSGSSPIRQTDQRVVIPEREGLVRPWATERFGVIVWKIDWECSASPSSLILIMMRCLLFVYVDNLNGPSMFDDLIDEMNGVCSVSVNHKTWIAILMKLRRVNYLLLLPTFLNVKFRSLLSTQRHWFDAATTPYALYLQRRAMSEAWTLSLNDS